tara:strand:- start:483 stop:683 length:201 start_codon:yes stop_codon:yes gene_type:complete
MNLIGKTTRMSVVMTLDKKEVSIMNEFFSKNKAYTKAGFVKEAIIEKIEKQDSKMNDFDDTIYIPD